MPTRPHQPGRNLPQHLIIIRAVPHITTPPTALHMTQQRRTRLEPIQTTGTDNVAAGVRAHLADGRGRSRA